ncbi:MAG: family 1 glycosylhydrolase [Myxococcota bacterium]
MGIIIALAIAAGLSIAYGVAVARRQAAEPELRWDWNRINTDEMSFPDGFLWGVATAAHQVEGGCDNNNWSRWETATAPDGSPRIARGQKAGRACDHWNRYEDDLKLIDDLGVAAYRLSLEWSKIEPEPGVYDEGAIRHYHQVISALRKAEIEPMLTLHHFTHPTWFEDLGSFEKVDNIDHLVRFAKRMFAEYGEAVELWCTINEPAVFTTEGWFRGIFPPGKQDPQLSAEVLANLVTAHTEIYRAIKAMPGGERAQVGLVKNIFQFDPDRRYHLGDWAVAGVLDHIFNDAILDCLKTGEFRASGPGISLRRDIPDAPSSLDFIGLNYYSHFRVRWKFDRVAPFDMVERPGDIRTDMPYPIYAEGLYRALIRIAELGWPIYVTENGIADATDDRRELFIRRYLYALSRAVRDGVDVRGYFYWTLMDNFEWAEGYDMRFGLYAMDVDTLERTLRPGSKAFVDIVKRSRDLG